MKTRRCSHRWLKATAAVGLAWGVGAVLCPAATSEESTLIMAMTGTGQQVLGELVEENDTHLTLREVSTGREWALDKSVLIQTKRDISETQSLQYETLPGVIAWKMDKLAHPVAGTGKIAQAQGTETYVSLGTLHGVAAGQQLAVFHHTGVVTDPDTHAVISEARQKVATLAVKTVDQGTAQAVIVGEDGGLPQVGDEVTPLSPDFQVAVAPLLVTDPAANGAASNLVEQLTTALVQRDIPVVERGLLEQYLAQSASPTQAGVYEPQAAQEMGKKLRATVILTGKVMATEKGHQAYLRLIDVGSGQILCAFAKPLYVRASGPTAVVAAATPGVTAGASHVAPVAPVVTRVTLPPTSTARPADLTKYDLTGPWTLTTKTGKTTTVQLTALGGNQYSFTPGGYVFSGMYEVRGDRLVMFQTSGGYHNINWRYLGNNTLLCLGDDHGLYAGFKMTLAAEPVATPPVTPAPMAAKPAAAPVRPAAPAPTPVVATPAPATVAAPAPAARTAAGQLANLDLSGDWTLTATNGVTKTVKLISLGDGRYSFVSSGSAFHGVYQIINDRLAMLEPGSRAAGEKDDLYTFNWRPTSADSFILTNTRYAGFTLTRGKPQPTP